MMPPERHQDLSRENIMRTQMDAFGLTDVGRRRTANEDHFLIADLNKSLRVHGTSLKIDDETRIYGGSQGKLMVVADGMGGEAEGERASTIAVDQVATYVLNSLSWCFRLEEDSELDFQEHLKEALKSCQESIHSVSLANPEMSSMGTTMTMAYIVWPRAFIVHVGDSRCYLFSNDRLQQITSDHTMAAILAESGRMTPEEARHSPMGNALVNVLGGKSDELSVDVLKLTLRVGDVLLLCTDGLHDMVPDAMLQSVLASESSSEATCRKLVDQANENGGKDNITLIVSRFLSPQTSEPRAFVEAEVPLDQLTGFAVDAEQDTVTFKTDVRSDLKE
jgi:serine/threonine protein phosphatase PrpC